MSDHVNITSATLADGDAAIRFLREREVIRRARSKRRWITAGIVLVGLFLSMVGCTVGCAAIVASTDATSATTAPAATGGPSAPASALAPSAAHSAPATTAGN